MAKVWVFGEMSEGKLNATAAEIMARARELGDVTVITLGAGAKAAAALLGKHGAKNAFVNEDPAFDEFLAEPATDALAGLHEKEPPDLILFSFTSDSRDIAGRLGARLGVGLISNASDVGAKDGGFTAKVPYFGGAKVASVRANAKPAIVLIRPKSFEASETGGAAEVKELTVSIPGGSKRARVLERVVEASEKVKLEDAKVVISGGWRSSPERLAVRWVQAGRSSTQAGCRTRCRSDRPANQYAPASTSRLASLVRCSTRWG